MPPLWSCLLLFFFNHPATTEIYTLSLHDALPISAIFTAPSRPTANSVAIHCHPFAPPILAPRCQNRRRSEEHTSELQSRQYLVCRLLLEKKKKQMTNIDPKDM